MGKPEKPRWATSPGLPTDVQEPSEPKKNAGWLPPEKPPAQFFNWLLRQAYLFSKFTDEFASTASLRSANPLQLNASTGEVSFSSDIEIAFKFDGDNYVNRIQVAASPLDIDSGEVLVARLSTASATVNLASGSYASLAEGQFCIVAESSLDDTHTGDEVIILRRPADVSAGNDDVGVGFKRLDIPLTGQSLHLRGGAPVFVLGGDEMGEKHFANTLSATFWTGFFTTRGVNINGAGIEMLNSAL
ncbi:MAG TPA: hypothetical protein VFW62_04630, partial [bacterium]|nr:hypothetical protein [bacterium]